MGNWWVLLRRGVRDLRLAYLVIRILVLVSAFCLASGCVGISIAPPTPTSTAPEPISPLIAAEILSHLKFKVVDGWQMIGDGQQYSNGPALLSVFVFDGGSATLRECVEATLQVVSESTVIDSWVYDDFSHTVAGEPAFVAVVEGHSSDDPGRPFRGLYVAFRRGGWIYLFAWDAFDEETQERLESVAFYTLESIEFDD